MNLMLNHITNMSVTVALLMSFTPLTVMAAEPSGFSLQFHPVGTPEFMGPPKIGLSGFIPPVAEIIYEPKEAKCLAEKITGEYEALVKADGSVSAVHSHHDPITGDVCEKQYLFPFIMKWRFKPATFDGKPTSVYMWFGLNL
jgi:hypothetical protein